MPLDAPIQSALPSTAPSSDQPAQQDSNNEQERKRKEAILEITQKTTEHLRRMRYFRRQYDNRRFALYRQYIGQRDTRYFPDNITARANTFVSYPYSNVETIVSRTLDAFFGFDPPFETRGRNEKDEAGEDAMQLVLHKKLKEARWEDAIESLVRTISIYGFGGIKVDWNWDFDTVTYPEPQFAMDQNGQPILDQMGQPIVTGYRPAVKQIPRACPRIIPIDIYDLFVDPDGGITAHLTERTWGQMKREYQAKPDLYFKEGMDELERIILSRKSKVTKAGLDIDSTVIRLAEVWNDYDQTQTVITFGEDAEAISWKDTRAAVRIANYSAFKRPLYQGPPILLYHGPNQFLHQKNPILYTSFTKLPNEVFGLGPVEIIGELVESLNKFVNMITDNWNLGINRRYAYDTNADIDHEALNNANVPGGKVGVSGDPSKVIMPLPFMAPQAGDYQLLGLYKGMIEMTSGISDFYQKGIGSPPGNQTATGIQSIIGETNYKFKMFIRNLELDIIQPLLRMCASMIQQFITDEIEVLVTNEMAAIEKYPKVRPEQLIGDYEFDIVAANYVSNKAIRQRNILAFANLVAPSGYIKEYEALLELAKVFEIRNAKNFLMTPQEVAQAQAAEQDREIKMMIFQSMLNTKHQQTIASHKAELSGGKEGRPRKAQFEGKIPGHGVSSSIREIAQSLGANKLGLEGLGEGGGG